MMDLVYKKTGETVEIGDMAEIGRGETVKVIGIEKPHKPSSTGRVYVQFDNEVDSSYFPSVIGAHWINREDQNG